MITKSERREKRKRNKRKMAMHGKRLKQNAVILHWKKVYGEDDKSTIDNQQD